MNLNWQRSSFCGTGACVEVIREGDIVVVRDGKFGDHHSVKQTFSAKRWQELIAALAGGRDYPDVLDVDDRVYLGRVVPLCFTAEEWTAFVAGVKNGEFNYDRLSTPAPDSARQVPEEAVPVGTGSGLAATGAGEDTSTSPAGSAYSLPDPAPVVVQPKGFGRRNVHCSNCGDERGGMFGHETSECRYRSGMTAEQVAELLPEHQRAAFWDLQLDRYFGTQGVIPASMTDLVATVKDSLTSGVPVPVAAQPREISDELVEIVARAQYEYDTDDIPTDLGYAWDETIAAVRNEYVRRARAGLEVAIPLLRKQWENEAEPAWGSGPLVDHNPSGGTP